MMRGYYSDLLNVNRQLIKDLKIRAGQGETLSQNLKIVKAMINKAGNLRREF